MRRHVLRMNVDRRTLSLPPSESPATMLTASTRLPVMASDRPGQARFITRPKSEAMRLGANQTRKSPIPVPPIPDLAGKRGRESPIPDSAGIGNREIPRFPIGRKSGNRGIPCGCEYSKHDPGLDAALSP
jgi:hypothetical protein